MLIYFLMLLPFGTDAYNFKGHAGRYRLDCTGAPLRRVFQWTPELQIGTNAYVVPNHVVPEEGKNNTSASFSASKIWSRDQAGLVCSSGITGLFIISVSVLTPGFLVSLCLMHKGVESLCLMHKDQMNAHVFYVPEEEE